MEFVLSIITTAIYVKLFLDAGEKPIYAVIPILNLYTLCQIVDAAWAFWVYVLGFVCYIMASFTGMPAIALICYLAVIVTCIFIYIRLLLADRDQMIYVIILIACELLRIFVV